MDISVVVPIYNAPEDVALCLDSLKQHFGGERCELLLINDTSGPETTELLRTFVKNFDEGRVPTTNGGQPLDPPFIRLVEHTDNRGYLHTVNEALGLASGNVIVLLNSDTVIPAGFAERVLACFASDEKIGLASPATSHCGLFSIPMKPGLTGTDVAVMDAPLRAHAPLYPTVILPDGFCFCIRRAVIDAIGLFDERYNPGYYEETDYGMRARQAGWKTVLIDNLFVFHKAQASFGSSRNKELVQRNKILFTELWGKEFDDLRARFPREEQKKRLYGLIYSFRERVWRRTARFLAQLCPHAPTRRAIRRKYN